MPETVMAHGWWLIDEKKMSKSRGNVVRPLDLATRYGVDAFRFYLIRDMVLGLDSSFSEESFIRRYNSELANDVGNLLNRTVIMVDRYLGATVPAVHLDHPVLGSLQRETQKTLDEVGRSLANLNLNDVLDAVWRLVRKANQFVEIQSPWDLAKHPDRRSDLEATIYALLETMRCIVVLLFPVIPGKAREMWRQLGLGDELEAMRLDELKVWKGFPPGSRVRPGGAVFPRIERTGPESGTEPEGDTSKEQQMAEERTNLVSIDEFQRLDLRIARIKAAEPVEGADRLLRLRVSLGDGERQLVAGVAQHYEPDALVGRQIVVVANLEPATIRGVESQGMLLAASGGGVLALLGPDSEVPDGAKVS